MKNNHTTEKRGFEVKALNIRILWDILFFITVLILLLLQFNPMMFTGGDNAYYISLADSIFQKGTYRALFKVGTPFETAITPGYPFLLGLTKLIFPSDYIALKYLSFVMYLLAMVFAYLLLRFYKVKRLIAYGFILIMVLSNSISEFSSWVLTEATFMAFSFGSIYYFERKADSLNNWKSLILPSFLIILAVYIRLPAGMILPTIFIYLWIRKNFKIALFYCAISTVLMLPWLIWMVAAPNEGQENLYLAHFFTKGRLEGEKQGLQAADLAERFTENIDRYFFEHMPDLFIPQFKLSEKGTLDYIYGSIILILIALGIFATIKKKIYFPFLYLILYTGLLLVNQSARLRYLIVALPMFFVLIYYSSEYIMSLFKKDKLFFIPVSIFLLVSIIPSLIGYPKVVKLTGHVRKYQKMGYEYSGLPAQWVSFLEVAKWVKSNTPEDAIILSRKPRMFYLYSGRQGDTFLFNEDPGKVMSNIYEQKAKFVILDQVRAEAGAYLYPTLLEYEDNFKVVHLSEAPETYVIAVLPDTRDKITEGIDK